MGSLNTMNGTPTRVFIARLAGLPVFDPTGDQTGRVRDVVVSLRVGNEPPRVLGFVVEVQPRRLVFLAATRVTNIDTGSIIFTGKINMRRFQQRSSETLVLGEMLDRRVQLQDKARTDGGETSTGGQPPSDADPASATPVTVVDVAMEQTRTRDWMISKIAVRRDPDASRGRGRNGGLRKSVPRPSLRRRRGETIVVDWDSVSGFSEPEQEQGAANLLAAFEELHAADLAQVVHELSPKRRAEVATALGDSRLAEILAELPWRDQVEILGQMDSERSARIVELMSPDDAADVLAQLSDEHAEGVLALMEPDEADPVRRLLTYPKNSAGGMMTTDPVILPPDATVAEALARVRHEEIVPAIAAHVYVCRAPTETPTGRYLGIAHIQRLLREPPSSLVSGLIDDDIDPLRPGRTLEEVASYLATYNLLAVPITDEDGHMLGAVTVDDVLDHLLPSNWRERALGEEPYPPAEGGSLYEEANR